MIRTSSNYNKSIKNVRYISEYAYKIAKKMMPKISDTERAALNAGTVGFDRNIFSGNPSLKDLEKYSVKASQDEQNFLDKEVHELCEILDDHQITEDRDMSEEFWSRCKKQGFFGMIIPKEYGGKGFSAHGCFIYHICYNILLILSMLFI
jgi:alkylation response protein AidB-like acyl-CoA dehydrogenase